MKTRIAAVLLLLFSLLVVVTPAQAQQQYEGARSIYNHPLSSYGVGMWQSYDNEYVVTNPGHWNFEYGKTWNEQVVNTIWVGYGACVRVYNLNAAGNGWNYRGAYYGWDYNSQAANGLRGSWYSTSGSSSYFKLGWNMIDANAWYRNSAGALVCPGHF